MGSRTLISGAALAAVTLLSVLAACVGASGATGTGIRGEVLLGPLCPVMIEEEPCPDQPYETRLVVTTADGAREIKEFRSGADGSFIVDLPPGEYALRLAAGANVLPFCATNGTLFVRSGSYTETTVFCDTGIR